MNFTTDVDQINKRFQFYLTLFSENVSESWTDEKTVNETKSDLIENVMNCLQLIHQRLLLHSKNNPLEIMTKHPEIGPLLNCICSQSTAYVSNDSVKLLIECIMWFYQPGNSTSLQMRANKWVQAQLKIISGQKFSNSQSSNAILLEIFNYTENSEMMKLFLLRMLEKQPGLDAATATHISTFALHFIDRNGFDQEIITSILKVLAENKENITSDKGTLSLVLQLCNLIYRSLKQDKIKFNHIDWINLWHYHHQSLEEEVLSSLNEILNKFMNKCKHLTTEKLKWLAEISSKNDFIYQSITNMLLSLLQFNEMHIPVILFLSSLNEEIKKITSEIYHLYPTQFHHLLLVLAIHPKELNDADLIKQHGLYIQKQFLLAAEKPTYHIKELIILLIAYQHWNFVFFYFLFSKSDEEFRISTNFFSVLHNCQKSCVISCCTSLRQCPTDNSQTYLELARIYLDDLDKPCLSLVIVIFFLFCILNCTTKNRECFLGSLLQSVPESSNFCTTFEWCKQQIEENGLNCLYKGATLGTT